MRGRISLSKHLQIVFEGESFKGVTQQQYIDYSLNHLPNTYDDKILKIVKQLEIPSYIGTNKEALRKSQFLNAIGPLFQRNFCIL